jgi:hypothetical protein
VVVSVTRTTRCPQFAAVFATEEGEVGMPRDGPATKVALNNLGRTALVDLAGAV